MTINEIRAKHSLEKIEGGDVILNQAYITALGMSQQQAQEQQAPQDQEEDDYDQEEGQEEGGETQDQEEPTQEDNEEEKVTKSLNKNKFTVEI